MVDAKALGEIATAKLVSEVSLPLVITKFSELYKLPPVFAIVGVPGIPG